ncbi:MAG: hypothetical protein ACLKAK_10190 [Alkaliphilus sp.]
MKIKLVFPPIWECRAPYPSLAYLSSFFKKRGYKVSVTDLNIKFQNVLLSRKYMESSLKKTEAILSVASIDRNKHVAASKAWNMYSLMDENSFDNAIYILKKQQKLRAYWK